MKIASSLMGRDTSRQALVNQVKETAAEAHPQQESIQTEADSFLSSLERYKGDTLGQIRDMATLRLEQNKEISKTNNRVSTATIGVGMLGAGALVAGAGLLIFGAEAGVQLMQMGSMTFLGGLITSVGVSGIDTPTRQDAKHAEETIQNLDRWSQHVSTP